MQKKHNKSLVPFARQLRKNMTKEERHPFGYALLSLLQKPNKGGAPMREFLSALKDVLVGVIIALTVEAVKVLINRWNSR